MTRDQTGEPDARQALLAAAKELLPQRPPSTVTGRELAAAAGVNYGLVHHYFGGKEAAFRAGLLELRADFLARHGIDELLGTLERDEPFLRAVGLSQTDYPRSLGAVDDFPGGDAIVAAVRERLVTASGPTDSGLDAAADVEADVDVEARARVMALLCVQLGTALFSELLHAVVGSTPDTADAVERELARIYRTIAAEPADARTAGRG